MAGSWSSAFCFCTAFFHSWSDLEEAQGEQSVMTGHPGPGGGILPSLWSIWRGKTATVPKAKFQETGSTVGDTLVVLFCWCLACPLEIKPSGLLRKPVPSSTPPPPLTDWNLRARRKDQEAWLPAAYQFPHPAPHHSLQLPVSHPVSNESLWNRGGIKWSAFKPSCSPVTVATSSLEPEGSQFPT